MEGQRVVVHAPGSYERLRLERWSVPAPRSREVQIEVRAIGVNYADCVVRMGLYDSARRFVGWPITPGFEVSGVISAVGDEVEGLCVGQAVLAVTRFGGYSTHVVVPAEQAFALPSSFDFAQGAGFAAVFMTAWYALFALAHPRSDDRGLVHSAAGGVGGALLQLLRMKGCHVVGVVGAPHKVKIAREQGADVVIDKSAEDLWSTAVHHAPWGYHIILDANGAATLKESYQHLGSPGKLVVYGFHTMLPRKGGRPRLLQLVRGWLRTPRFDPLKLTGDNHSVLAFNLSYLFSDERRVMTEAMTQLLGWVEEGHLVAPHVTRFRFDQVADAHRALESGQTVGKLILEP